MYLCALRVLGAFVVIVCACVGGVFRTRDECSARGMPGVSGVAETLSGCIGRPMRDGDIYC